MSHEIETFLDGTSAFYSHRELAWHRLGTVTDAAKNAEEAARIAQLDWPVFKTDEQLLAPVPKEVRKMARKMGVAAPKLVEVPDRYGTVRLHPKTGVTGLGAVGTRWAPIQNAEGFEWLTYLADDTGAVFETAGSMNDGRRAFMTMKMPKSMMLGGEDQVDMYLMATLAHDGTGALTAAATPVRAVCANTVRVALAAAVSTWTVQHTSGAKDAMRAAADGVKRLRTYTDAFELTAGTMASVAFSDAEFDAFLDDLVPDLKKDSERQMRTKVEMRAQMGALWDGAGTLQGVRNTRWAAWNAVTEWSDWVSKSRGGDEGRALRIMREAGSSPLKTEAFKLLTADLQLAR